MIALIPARGGSKGLPGKNIKLLHNKPLISYTIEAALEAKQISRVIVNTDCEKIAEIAKQYGAEVPWLRPKELATDNSRAIETYLHTIDELKKEGTFINDICVLLPTCPLRIANDIDGAIALFLEKNADSVVSFTEEAHPIKWHKYIKPDLKFENIFEESIKNRQEEKVSYYPNGSIYVFRTDLLKQGTYYSANSYAFLMPRNRSIDIDTIDDFNYANFLLNDGIN